MEEWKEYRLGEICEKITDGSHSSPKAQESGYPMFSVKDMLEYGFDYSKCKFISQEDYIALKQSGCVPQKGDVLVAKDGSYLKQIFVCKESKDEAILSSIAIFRPNKLVDSYFLNYLLKSPQVYNYIANNCVSGSALPRIVLKDFKSVKLPIPSIETQNIIVSILKSLDDKIELNRKINANLEAQAQALFKSWFVDFEPFKDQPFVESELGMIPEGWKVVSLGDLMSYNGGSQPPASEFIEEYKEGYVRFVQIRDYASDGHITYIPVSKRNKLCDVRDIMIARYGASLGRICYGLKGAYNVALAKVTPNKPFYLEYLRCFFNTREFYEGINNKGNRAVQAGFNQSDIQSFRVVFPKNEEIIQRFENICSVSFDKRLHLEQESRRLASLRDTLLPRLMSGELKVNDVNI